MNRFIGAAALGAILGLGACSADAPLPAAKEFAAIRPDPAMGDGGVSDFYVWTDAMPAKPGRLLRSEALGVEQSLSSAGTGVRILYASTDGLGGTSPVIVSGALFLPKGDAPRGGWPLLAWAHGTVGVADICAPSWTARSERDATYLGYWLSQGYAVVASDYQGLGTAGGHPYLATRPAAFSVLDSVRAVQGGAFPVSREVVLIGQSQGGGAAFATGAYAPTYAPELDIRAVVATGTPYFSPKAQAALEAARPRDAVDPLLAYNFLAMSLVEQTDKAFRVEDYISAETLPTARSIRNTCFRDQAQRVMAEKITYNRAYIREPADQLVKAYELMGYPNLNLRMPVFMGAGGRDRDVPPAMQLSLASDACKAGAVIEAHLYPALDHSGTVNGSTGESSVFIRKAFAGERIMGNCSSLPALSPPS
jgi:pimeloyl-ACP methyl ester carboxylesterase